jgi:outer membrane protein assembly factor BamD (BamD/ComL family)
MRAPSSFRHFRPASRFLAILAAVFLLDATAAARQDSFELGPDDRWELEGDGKVSTAARQVLQARKALALGEPQRARALASAYLDKFPGGEVRPEMLLVRGDALVEMGDEYKALFDYEAITRKYSGSRAFVTALEREYQIAVAYADGLKRKFLGTFRILDASDDAQELLIRIQERLPGSRLAEDAGMKLADFYFDRSQMRLAADAYDLFVQNYPRSERIEKARERLIQSYLASYRGPRYDDTGLRDARRRLELLRVTQPSLAQRVGADALLVRIDESVARKLLTTARWYLSIDDPVSAELYLRRVVELHPATVAALDALRLAPRILAQMPARIAAETPNYQALAEALLGAEAPRQLGIEARPEIPLPASKSLSPETPVEATANPEPQP